jgi:3'-phosphoadenosine 5'-phosphosulfate (PAPS) 3'-phosphatase
MTTDQYDRCMDDDALLSLAAALALEAGDAILKVRERGFDVMRKEDRSPVTEEGLTVLASRYHGSSTRLDEFLRDKRVAKLINFGSSVKFCRLAEGIADLYPRFGRTMEWDTCAPQAVLEAAGGTVRTFDGAILDYGKPGWENPHFVCTGREQ